jgi:hypothetical protein
LRGLSKILSLSTRETVRDVDGDWLFIIDDVGGSYTTARQL